MLIHFQFPITDLRAFTDRPRLSAPNWPTPVADVEFVRASGGVRKRPQGGLNGWIAEDFYCDGRRALTFDTGALTALGSPRVAFRRLYFDGSAVGKFEIGFSIDRALSGDEFQKVLRGLMDMSVKVHSSRATAVSTRLADAGELLSSLYARSSTRNGQTPEAHDVIAGEMVVFTSTPAAQLAGGLPRYAKGIDLAESSNLQLRHWWWEYKGVTSQFWVCLHDDVRESESARNLRVYVLRLNAESQSLRRVLKAVSDNRIQPARGTPASERLQEYLNNATNNLLSLSDKTRKFAAGNSRLLAAVAAATEEAFSANEREAFLAKLRAVDIRPNIFNKVQDTVAAPAQPLGEHGPAQRIVIYNFSLFSNFGTITMKGLTQGQSGILAFIFGVIFVTVLLVVSLVIPNPTPSQFVTFRTIMALAAGGVAAVIPGILNINMSAGPKFALQAGGALAVFVIVFFYHPGLPPG